MSTYVSFGLIDETKVERLYTSINNEAPPEPAGDLSGRAVVQIRQNSEEYYNSREFLEDSSKSFSKLFCCMTICFLMSGCLMISACDLANCSDEISGIGKVFLLGSGASVVLSLFNKCTYWCRLRCFQENPV